MQVKDLRLKRALRAALLVLLLGAAGMTKGYAWYSFSAVCSTGQTLYYKITDATNHYVSVTYPGNSNLHPWNGYMIPTGNLVIPEIVTRNSVDYSVTSIDGYSFDGCSGLTDLTIPNSVTSIGSYAFRNCSGLTTVNWDAVNVTITHNYPPFENCTNLTTVIFGDQVQTIPAIAFYGCSGLTGSLTIPNSVTSIGNGAFYNCRGLTGSLTIPNSVTSIGSSAFSGCRGLTGSLTIPNSVTSIGSSAFSGCRGLTELTIPNSVTSIGNGAFHGCSGLTGLTIPNSVTSIGNYAFSGCSGLTVLTIPDSVTSIGNVAFSGCSGLTVLTIPDSVTSIGDYAFYGCSGLIMVNWNAVNVTSYPSDTTYHPFGNCTNLTMVVFGDQVRRIPDYAFYNCSGLTGLTIGNSVTSIWDEAFSGCSGLTTVNWNAVNVTSYQTSNSNHPFKNCTNLTTVVFGNQVQTIPNYAFSGCSGLTALTIGNSVTSIGDEAFSGCSGLTTVYWNAVNVISYPTSTSSHPFKDCPNLTTVVFGDQVQTIPDYAFSGYSGLTALTIGNSVTSIGYSAFSGCSGLEYVHYTGDISQWCNIEFDNYLSNPLYYAHNLYINDELVTNLEIPESVIEIKKYAFCGCSCLTSLMIGNSVTSIGSSAFSSCSGLTDLTIGNSVTSIGYTAFYGCSGLTTVNWNAVSVTSYPTPSNYSDALPFKNCTSLTTVVFGDQVQTIPNYAFSGCSGLTGSLTIPNSVTSIGGSAFSGCSGLTELTIPNSVTSIGNYVFYGCSGLTGLTIPNSVTSIGNYAFSGCSGLTVLTIPDSVTSIGNYAFSYCSGLTDLTIGNSVTSIGNVAFYGCSGLTALTIPNSVTSIGIYAFENCSGLESVNYTGDIAQWCNIEFASSSSNPIYYAHNLYINDELVTNLEIPESVTEIKNYAFYGCSGLTGTLTIPNSVTSIGNYAFRNCSGLTSLTIGNSVTSIGSYAFSGCSGLTGTLTIPNSVTTIGSNAFSNCTGINAIRMQCPAPPTIAGNTFNNIDKSIPLFVACGTQEAYLAADYWPEFTTINESPYDLVITQNDPYGGEVSVVHYADCDDNHCAILAINNIGYNFIGWFVNDYFSTDSPYCDFSLIDNVTFEARFERKPNHFITIVTSTSNTWSDPDTWDTGEVPSSTSTVAIYKDIIVDVDAEVSELGVYEDNFITISPDVTLTVTDTLGSENVASIVIEDGGQLIHSSDEAMATVKKSIEPYTTNADGWNLISFPLTGNGTVASIGNMLNNEYDLYAYDEPTQYWINQKEENNGFTALEAGQGYLYANKGTGMGLAAGSKIGEGTSTIGNTPFYTYYEYSIAENLFLATELEAAGLPTTALGGLCWYATNQTGYLQSNISIWMANVNDEALTTTSHNVSEMTLVYTGDMTPVVGWNTFVFNENNFTWDGTSNVLVCVQRNNGTYNSTVYWQAHNPGFAATSYKYNYSSAYDMTAETYSMNVSSTLRPNTIFQTLEQVGEYEYYEPITMSFAGEIENGAATVTVPLSYTETAGNLKGFNLVGNPFVHNVTSYGSANVAEGCFRLNEVKDNLIVSEVSETLPLKPAEGFFVKATDVGASITFNPGRSRGENDRKGFVNLELRENGKLIDRLIVKREGDPLEKLMLKGNGTRLYALQDRQEIAIVPCEGDEQAVCFKADENGSYTINVSVNGFELDYLYLIDNLTGNDVNLLVEPSYSFEAKTTDYASRFKLVFATGSSVDSETDSFAFINSNGNLSIFGIEGEATVQVIDILGHMLSSETFSGSYEKKINGTPGVYMVRLLNGDDVKVQKIVVK